MNIKKSRIISFRVDDQEYQAIKAVAGEMGFYCLSDYARQVLLQSLGSKCNPPSVNNSQLRRLTRLLDDLAYEARNLLGRTNHLEEDSDFIPADSGPVAPNSHLPHESTDNPVAHQSRA
jgi:hypothetical protein